MSDARDPGGGVIGKVGNRDERAGGGWDPNRRLLPNRNLLFADRLDLRDNAQHITCLLRWSDLRSLLYMRQIARGGW